MERQDNNRSPIHIGTDRQLFVDNFWIAEARGVTQRLHEPVRREVVISPEHPWERGGVFLYGHVPRGRSVPRVVSLRPGHADSRYASTAHRLR